MGVIGKYIQFNNTSGGVFRSLLFNTFNTFFSVVRAHFKLQSKIMRIYYLQFKLPLVLVSCIENHFKFITLNNKNIYTILKVSFSNVIQKEIIPAFRIMMLEKETTLNKLSHSNGLITQWTIYDGDFLFLAVNYFCNKTQS